MRIAIGQLWQESNTFNPIPTTLEDFEQFGVLRGAELVERMASTNELGGFITSLREWPERPEIVGLVRLPAWPAGPVTDATFEWILSEFRSAIDQAMPVDAMLLALHGSLVAEGAPDVEGALLNMIRARVGHEIPIVATLDLHANVTEQMVRNADALVLYHTIPHVDVFETGQRGASTLRRIMVGGARPVTAYQKLPMVVPAERANTEEAASVSLDFKERLKALESQTDVLAAGIATVQPWLDIPEMGSAVLVTTDGDPERARNECASLAADLWSRRRDYLPELVSVEEGVRAAWECPEALPF